MAVTTPDTSAVRAWARSNGYDVADRGRLPADLTDAYLAAQGKGSGKASSAAAKPAKKAAKKPAKPTAAKKAPARKAATAAARPAAKPAAATAPKPTPKPAPKPEAAPAAAPAAASAPAATAEPKPKPVNDDRRLVALGEQLTALTARVAELEKSVGSKPAGNGVAKRFRRSR